MKSNLLRLLLPILVRLALIFLRHVGYLEGNRKGIIIKMGHTLNCYDPVMIVCLKNVGYLHS